MIKPIEESRESRVILDYLQMLLGDVRTTTADTQWSRTKLNFSPKTSISSGVPNFCEWYVDPSKIIVTVKLRRDNE